jgi:hypothetical protein
MIGRGRAARQRSATIRWTPAAAACAWRYTHDEEREAGVQKLATQVLVNESSAGDNGDVLISSRE